jgi:hypothetical protein
MSDCDRFEQAWQRHFDGESPGPPSDLAGWDEHFFACAECQAVDRRYRALGMALDHWRESASAPVSQRVPGEPGGRFVRSGAAASGRSSRNRTGFVAAGLAIAASVALVALGPAMWSGRDTAARLRPAPLPAIASQTNPLLDTSAVTARLARVAALPVALLGRDMLGEPALESAQLPSEELAGAPARIREIGGRVFSTFQPLTLRAREAFDFIVPGRPAVHDRPESTGRGA